MWGKWAMKNSGWTFTLGAPCFLTCELSSSASLWWRHATETFTWNASLVFLFAFSSYSTSSFKVYLGRLALQTSTPNEIISTVRRVIKHPLYSQASLLNDIALLELSAPVKFTNYIRPVCLAAEDSEFSPGTNGWITGWGGRIANGRTEHCWAALADRRAALTSVCGQLSYVWLLEVILHEWQK